MGQERSRNVLFIYFFFLCNYKTFLDPFPTLCDLIKTVPRPTMTQHCLNGRAWELRPVFLVWQARALKTGGCSCMCVYTSLYFSSSRFRIFSKVSFHVNIGSFILFLCRARLSLCSLFKNWLLFVSFCASIGSFSCSYNHPRSSLLSFTSHLLPFSTHIMSVLFVYV